MLNQSIFLFENFELDIILLIKVLCTVQYKETYLSDMFNIHSITVYE